MRDNVVRAWIRTAPVASVITALGVVLTLILWWGLRSIETERGQVDQERQFLTQSTGIEQQIVNKATALEAVALNLGLNGGLSTDQIFNIRAEQLGPLGYAAAVADRVDALELERNEQNRGPFKLTFNPTRATYPALVLTRLAGTDVGSDLVGANIGASTALFSELQRQEVSERVTMAQVTDAEFSLLGEPGTGVLLATRVTEGDGASGEVIGVLIGWVDVAALGNSVADDASLVVISVDGQLLGVAPTSGEQFGEPFEFSAAGIDWSIQGYTIGSTTKHWLSWSALLAGGFLTLAAAGFARSVRQHAVTLGRLQRSEFDARHDELTGLLNRAGITAEVDKLVARRSGNEMVGLLFCDLDRLKVVNDSIGHSAGDEVLVVVAERLARVVRPEDVIGRFGGDEFVIATLGLPAVGDLERLAQRLLEALNEPIILSDESSQMASASVGIAMTSDPEGTSEALLRDADSAMYRAKDAGGATYVVFDSELRAQALARLEVERELRRAIRHGQLVVHYQPIIDVSDGSVSKVEALVRWAHPERGMIAPGQFLSVAAESGLIVELGEHVLREAVHQAATWSEMLGRPLVVSVNVAERQLLDNSLIRTVRRVLRETGLAASQLELEISEELIVERLDGRLGMLRELAAMGVKLAIDDFGTSRASLSQLKLLDMVHTLKIDRAFVNDVATDEVDRSIVTAIIALAKSVNMEIVAEGVEDADQATVLNELGVDQIQGFYFARPAASDRVSSLLGQKFALPWEKKVSAN